MGRYAKDSSDNFQQAPTGAHVARCVKIIDIGTQHGSYEGKATVRNQVIVGWELPNEQMDDGNPFVVSRFYTNSLNEKAALRADLEAWRGRAFTEEELNGFDLMNILGKPCQLSIVDKDGKSRISGVMAMPKGMQCPPQINQSMSFWLDEWNQSVYDSLSDGFKKLITASDEYKELFSGASKPQTQQKTGGKFDDLEDSIPF